MHLFGANSEANSGSFQIAVAGLFKLICCTYKNSEETERLNIIQNSLASLSRKLDILEKHLQSNDFLEPRSSRKRTTVLEGSRASRIVSQLVTSQLLESRTSDMQSIVVSEVEPNSWLYDGELARGEVDFLSTEEENFWKEILDKYLHPIDDTENKKRKVGSIIV